MRYHLTFIVAIALNLICVLNLLTSCNSRASSDYDLNILFDRADGLTDEAPVEFKGLEIGRVTEIGLHEDQKVIVRASIENQYQIPKGSSFVMRNIDFLGAKGIEISFSDQTEFYKDGDTIDGKMGPPLTDQLDSLLRRIRLDSILLEMKEIARSLDSLENKPD